MIVICMARNIRLPTKSSFASGGRSAVILGQSYSFVVPYQNHKYVTFISCLVVIFDLLRNFDCAPFFSMINLDWNVKMAALRDYCFLFS